MNKVYCKNCNQQLSEDNKVCSNCGSKKKNVILEIKEKIEHHDWIKGKTKNKCIKRPVQEIFAGDNLCKKSGVWNYKEMNINRETDFYGKVIKDKTTGMTMWLSEGPLSEHKGYGSAKHKQKK